MERTELDVHDKPGILGTALQRPIGRIVIQDDRVDVFRNKGVLPRLLGQRSDLSVIRHGNSLDVYEGQSGIILDRLCQRPDVTWKVEESGIKVYNRPPARLVGRAFQQPDRTFVPEGGMLQVDPQSFMLGAIAEQLSEPEKLALKTGMR